MSEFTSRPLIAVTGPVTRFPVGWWATRLMLSLAGLDAVHVTAALPHLKTNVDGIVIGGGDDIEPGHYGAENHPMRSYDPDRDRFEMAMIRHALSAGVPMVGICRGAQLINVVAKGTLHGDIRPLRKLTPNRMRITPAKWVALCERSHLREYLGVERIKVNSLHNQAVDAVGQGLKVVGRDRDGFIQAVESERGFILGVQWHPEYLPYKYYQRRLFGLFAEAVHSSRRQLQLHE